MGTQRPDPVEYMLDVAQTPSAVAYKAHVSKELSLQPGLTVVDVGCGPATDLPEAADRVGPAGCVVGLDLDRRMLAAASSRVPPDVLLVACDAGSMPFKAAAVDRIRTDRSFQHMRQPDRVLAEFRRVLRPGGIAVLAEPDWGALIVDGGRADVAERFARYTCAEVVHNATISRAIPRLGHDVGFIVQNVVAFPTVIRDFATADKIFGLTRNVQAAASAGYLAMQDADDWLIELRSNPMLVAVTLFATTLVAPNQ